MLSEKPEIFCLGASHKSAEISFRETLYLTGDQLLQGLPSALHKYGFSELAALSTCNRFEMFGVSHNGLKEEHEIISAYLELQHSARRSECLNADAEKVKASTYLLRGRQAVEHLFSVASSLDSLIVGETQITGQFKSAIAIAKEAETLGKTLDRLAQDALGTAKKVRTQTAVGKKTVSISHAALDLSKKVFKNIANHKILIVGTGEMGEVAAKYAARYAPVELLIANRTRVNAESLCKKLSQENLANQKIDKKLNQPCISAHSLADIPQLLQQADIVISATGASGHIITKKNVLAAQKRRRGRPLFMVDIALPRDIEESSSDIDDVYLFDIDDLRQVVDDNIDHRRKESLKAETIVCTVANQFEKWLDGHHVKPAIGLFNLYLSETISKELKRATNRGDLASLSDSQQKDLARMMESLKNKIAGDVARNLNSLDDAHSRDNLAAAVGALFKPRIRDK